MLNADQVTVKAADAPHVGGYGEARHRTPDQGSSWVTVTTKEGSWPRRLVTGLMRLSCSTKSRKRPRTCSTCSSSTKK